MMGSEETRGRSHSRELERLQNMVRKLGLNSDVKTDSDELINEDDSFTGNHTNGYLNGSLGSNFDGSFEDSAAVNGVSLNRTLDDFNELDLAEGLDHVQEDSWLCDSPAKAVMSPKSPYVWLKEDVNTPELRRARPSLVTKLDLIGIQNRDEQLEKIMSQHGFGEDRPGRLYHSASFASMVSLDWDYENEDGYSLGMPSLSSRRPLSFTDLDFEALPSLEEIGRRGGPRHAWSDNPRKPSMEYENSYGRPSYRRASGERGSMDYDEPYMRQPRKISYELEDPYSYHGRKFSFELDDPYGDQEELDPLNIEFGSPPTLRRSVVAPNPVITKRAGPQGSPARSRSPEKYADFADDNLIAKPRGNVRPRKSRYTFERSDSKDSDSNVQAAPAQQSDQSDIDSIGEQPSPRPSRSSSRGSILSDDTGPVRPRGAKGRWLRVPHNPLLETSIEEESEELFMAVDVNSPFFTEELNNSSTQNTPSAAGPVKRRSPKQQQQQPQVRLRGAATAVNPDKGDASLKVKLPLTSASGGPVVRRRGTGTPATNGNGVRPSSPLGADSSSQESLTMSPAPRLNTSTPKTRQSLPQPRRSGPGTGIPTPRGGIPKVRRSASPDLLARRSESPDARPRPRRGPGLTSQDQSPLVTQSWQAGMY